MLWPFSWIRWWPAPLLVLIILVGVEGCGDRNQPVSSDNGGRTGQDIVEGVRGRVLAPNGSPIIDAFIQARSLDVPANPVPDLGVLTQKEGWYSWPLSPGTYSITVSAMGYQPASRSVRVEAGQTTRLDFTLDRKP